MERYYDTWRYVLGGSAVDELTLNVRVWRAPQSDEQSRTLVAHRRIPFGVKVPSPVELLRLLNQTAVAAPTAPATGEAGAAAGAVQPTAVDDATQTLNAALRGIEGDSLEQRLRKFISEPFAGSAPQRFSTSAPETPMTRTGGAFDRGSTDSFFPMRAGSPTTPNALSDPVGSARAMLADGACIHLYSHTPAEGYINPADWTSETIPAQHVPPLVALHLVGAPEPTAKGAKKDGGKAREAGTFGGAAAGLLTATGGTNDMRSAFRGRSMFVMLSLGGLKEPPVAPTVTPSLYQRLTAGGMDVVDGALRLTTTARGLSYCGDEIVVMQLAPGANGTLVTRPSLNEVHTLCVDNRYVTTFEVSIAPRAAALTRGLGSGGAGLDLRASTATMDGIFGAFGTGSSASASGPGGGGFGGALRRAASPTAGTLRRRTVVFPTGAMGGDVIAETAAGGGGSSDDDDGDGAAAAAPPASLPPSPQRRASRITPAELAAATGTAESAVNPNLVRRGSMAAAIVRSRLAGGTQSVLDKLRTGVRAVTAGIRFARRATSPSAGAASAERDAMAQRVKMLRQALGVPVDDDTGASSLGAAAGAIVRQNAPLYAPPPDQDATLASGADADAFTASPPPGTIRAHFLLTIDSVTGVEHDACFVRFVWSLPLAGVTIDVEGNRRAGLRTVLGSTSQTALASRYLDEDYRYVTRHTINMPVELHCLCEVNAPGAPRLLVEVYSGGDGCGPQTLEGYGLVTCAPIPGRRVYSTDLWRPTVTGEEAVRRVFLGGSPSLVDAEETVGLPYGIHARAGRAAEAGVRAAHAASVARGAAPAAAHELERRVLQATSVMASSRAGLMTESTGSVQVTLQCIVQVPVVP